jgi:hypothetical protein
MNVKTNLEFKKKWLQWVVDFIQMDLNSLSKPNLRGKCTELIYFSGLGFVERSFEEFLSMFNFDKLPEIHIDNFDFNELMRLRKQISDERSRLLYSNEDLEEVLSKFAPELQDIQNALRDFIEKTQKILVEPLKTISPITGKEVKLVEILLPDTENRLDIEPFYGSLCWKFMFVPKDYSHRDWAILNLSRLMDGVYVNAIRNCKGCGRYFLSTSAREKLYCNSLCASRSITRMKYEERKKHPGKYKAYLRKQNEYSKARYRKLMMQMRPNLQIGKLAKKGNHKQVETRKED